MTLRSVRRVLRRLNEWWEKQSRSKNRKAAQRALPPIFVMRATLLRQ